MLLSQFQRSTIIYMRKIKLLDIILLRVEPDSLLLKWGSAICMMTSMIQRIECVMKFYNTF